MRKKGYMLFVFCLALCACQKEGTGTESREVVIRVGGDIVFSQEAKAAPVYTTVPPSLYWGTTVDGVTETVKYDDYLTSTQSVEEGLIHTGKYQTAVPTSYNWYVANSPLSFIVPSGSVTDVTLVLKDMASLDVVTGCCYSEKTPTPSIILKHVASRIGTLTFNDQTDYTATDVMWKAARRGDVTYSLKNDSYTASADGAVETLSPDVFYVPGEHTITITYTLHRDNYTETITRSGKVTLKAGCVNNLTATATGGDAVLISVTSVSLTDWNNAGKEFVL